jgi:L-aminopeptidase/D-esterase-like protein
MKGGIGCVELTVGDVCVAAVAAVNAFGDVRDSGGRIIAGSRDDDGTFLDAARLLARDPARLMAAAGEHVMRNTTISVVATNATMDRSALTQLARAASAAYYKRITPAGTSVDGDIVFALCTEDGPTAPAMHVEALAVAALEEAIERAVRTAQGRDGFPGLADRT